MEEHEESQYLFKTSCDNCGSSDANAVYDDEHTYCFSCGKTVPGNQSNVSDKPRPTRAEGLLDVTGGFPAWASRGLTEETIRKWGCGIVTLPKGEKARVFQYKDHQSNLIGQKSRPKEKDDGRAFGDMKNAGLFGMHLWRDGGKKIVITEGEIDAMSVSQLQSHKWPVVSVKGGAHSAHKNIAAELEWLGKFQEVILCFDMDEQGQEAAQKCAALFKPGTCKIAQLSLNDANEMLTEGLGGELIDALWSAKVYRPAGIVNGKSVMDRYRNKPHDTFYPFPDYMESLNVKMLGLALGTVTTITSGSGMGKTSFVKNLQHHFLRTTALNQAIIHLEETVEETTDHLIGLEIGSRINIPEYREIIGLENILEAGDKLFEEVDAEGYPRLNLYDAFGSIDDALFDKVRYFAHGLGCKLIWIDHLSIMVSGMGDDGDERRRIDQIMTGLAEIAVELNIAIVLISHLKKAPQGKSFEEGYTPSLDDLRGSGGIKQMSWNVIALSRNQQHEIEEARNQVLTTVLKCRNTGRTGPADWLAYGDHTGRFEKGIDPDSMGADEEPEGDDCPF